eukprot:TRINITY_DN2089_c0_g2_i6.p1 TRINITY_DN2089_c0_g2~~TRINITY_DN2089_c0_g2_i6.p1  ORF type:complete len:454 (-),score=114.01 TRINITY_DN2089_c0_g2_i6:26-1387(-)
MLMETAEVQTRRTQEASSAAEELRVETHTQLRRLVEEQSSRLEHETRTAATQYQEETRVRLRDFYDNVESRFVQTRRETEETCKNLEYKLYEMLRRSEAAGPSRDQEGVLKSLRADIARFEERLAEETRRREHAEDANRKDVERISAEVERLLQQIEREPERIGKRGTLSPTSKMSMTEVSRLNVEITEAKFLAKEALSKAKALDFSQKDWQRTLEERLQRVTSQTNEAFHSMDASPIRAGHGESRDVVPVRHSPVSLRATESNKYRTRTSDIEPVRSPFLDNLYSETGQMSAKVEAERSRPKEQRHGDRTAQFKRHSSDDSDLEDAVRWAQRQLKADLKSTDQPRLRSKTKKDGSRKKSRSASGKRSGSSGLKSSKASLKIFTAPTVESKRDSRNNRSIISIKSKGTSKEKKKGEKNVSPAKSKKGKRRENREPNANEGSFSRNPRRFSKRL